MLCAVRVSPSVILSRVHPSACPPPLPTRSIETTVSRRRKGKLRASLLLLGLRGGCTLTQGEPRRVARGRDRRRGGEGRLDEETVLAAVCWLTYLRTKSERLLPVNVCARTKSINHPSANERKRKKGDGSEDYVASSFRGVARDDEVSYRKIGVSDFLFLFFFHSCPIFFIGRLTDTSRVLSAS